MHKLLTAMPNLTSLVLKNLGVSQGGESWQPAFDLISRNHTFTEVIITDAGLEANKDQTEALQYGPRLHAAKQQYLKQPKVTTEDFVEALVSVRDRVDCLDRLLSTTDPSLFARPAVEGKLQ